MARAIGSVPGYLLGESLINCLMAQGATAEQIRVASHRPSVAKALVTALHEAIGESETSDDYDAAFDLNVVGTKETSIDQVGLEPTHLRTLRTLGVTTLGELSVFSTEDFREELKRGRTRNLDEKIRRYELLLSVHGLSFRANSADAFSRARSVYRGAGNIPARLMRLWISGLDNRAQAYLLEAKAHKNLATVSRREFIEAHKIVGTSDPGEHEQQADLVAEGLRRANLTFRGSK